MAASDKSFVDQFSERLRRFLIGGNEEYDHDYRSSSKFSVFWIISYESYNMNLH